MLLYIDVVSKGRPNSHRYNTILKFDVVTEYQINSKKLFSFWIWAQENTPLLYLNSCFCITTFLCLCELWNRQIDATTVLLSKLYRVHSTITIGVTFFLAIDVRLCTNCVCEINYQKMTALPFGINDTYKFWCQMIN